MNQIKNFLLCTMLLACMGSCGQKPVWKGTLVYQYAGGINEYNFSTKAERTIFKEAAQPFVSGGEVAFISDAFQKRGYLVRKRTAAGQYRDLLDLSSENPDYKEALEAYSVIRGTGISGVLSSISDPKLSPNGKYLSVTVYGYKGQAFENNCVAVFDMASKKLVTKFNDKYYGAWMPDGRLVVSGWHKKESSDGVLYKGAQPGIFITDAALGNVKRIDSGLDDPAPYHATPSPDGKRIAFIMNNHLWVMQADGSDARQLTDVDNDNIETFPAWSPDGSSIACWVYKTFERSYFTAIAVVPSKVAKPVVLSDKAAVWPRDPKGKRLSGGTNQMSWK